MTGENLDAQELRKFGYAQQLRRSMGAFSSFAVSFSLISVFTGLFANFGHGLKQVGGAVVWSWLIVLAGQFLVALVLAELSTRIPLSGYGYQWTSRLVNPHYGFIIGWLLTLQFVTGFPGVCATLASQAGNWLGGGWAEPRMIVALTLCVIALVTMVHLAGIRAASLVNNTGVWTELVGVAGLSIVLMGIALSRNATSTMLFETHNAGTAAPAGWGAWSLSLLLGAWCLTGFEAAADLAEETHQPRRVVPKAMLLSLLSSGGAGLLLLAGAVGCIRDLPATQAADSPLLMVLTQTLGRTWINVVLAVVAISIFACALASMGATSRLLFALARDRMLPAARWLSFVAPGQRTPRNAILLIWAVSSAVVLGLPTLDIITQISAVAGYLGYAGITVAALRSHGPLPADAFSLGRSQPWIAGAALVWVLGLVGALTVPPTPLTGIATQHLPALSTGIAILIGLALYFIVIRRRLLRGQAGPPHADAENIRSCPPPSR